jgi:hypothetical protein
MKSKLMITAAMVALIGGTTFAVAQQQEEKGAAPKAGGTEQHGAPSGGAMQHSQAPSGAMEHKSMAPGGAAQNQATPEKGDMQRGAEETTKPGTNAQEHAQTAPNGKTEENAQTQERSKTQENAQTQERGNANDSAAKTGASGGKSAQLSETQRTQIKDVIVKDRNVARVNNVNFNITVGAAVPRSVHFAVLPVDVVTIVPEYRGFDYIIVGDQLLIIDPNSLEIVDILPV